MAGPTWGGGHWYIRYKNWIIFVDIRPVTSAGTDEIKKQSRVVSLERAFRETVVVAEVLNDKNERLAFEIAFWNDDIFLSRV